MRISDWSSDVFSSDLQMRAVVQPFANRRPVFEQTLLNINAFSAIAGKRQIEAMQVPVLQCLLPLGLVIKILAEQIGRASCREVSVRVDLGGRRISKKKSK